MRYSLTALLWLWAYLEIKGEWEKMTLDDSNNH